MVIATQKSPSGVEMEISIPESDNKVIYLNYKYYLVDKNRNIISRRYDEIHTFVNGLAVVKKGGKKGVISSNGEEILRTAYDNAYVDNYAIRICSKGKWGIADYKGRVVRKPFCYFIEAFKEPISRYESEDHKWGVLKASGKIIIYAKYNYLGELNKSPIIAKDFSKYGGIDLKDNVIVPFQYYHMKRKENGQRLLFNFNNEQLVV